jgi:hypothetical protein
LVESGLLRAPASLLVLSVRPPVLLTDCYLAPSLERYRVIRAESRRIAW